MMAVLPKVGVGRMRRKRYFTKE
jgi:hypothetical protein